MTKILNRNNQFYTTLIIAIAAYGLFWWLMRGVVETNLIWEWLICWFFLLFLLPVLVVKVFYKEKLSNFHLNFNFTFKQFLLGITEGLILIGLIWLLLVKLNWYEKFPVSDVIAGSKEVLFLFQLLILPFVLFFQEFFFRGFLMRSAEKSSGAIVAVVLQAILVLVVEVAFGIPFNLEVLTVLFLASLVLGLIVLQTRTIIISFLVSWGVNVVINLIIFQQLSLLER